MKDWLNSERFQYIKRDYTHKDVELVMPSIQSSYVSTQLANKLYKLFSQHISERYVRRILYVFYISRPKYFCSVKVLSLGLGLGFFGIGFTTGFRYYSLFLIFLIISFPTLIITEIEKIVINRLTISTSLPSIQVFTTSFPNQYVIATLIQRMNL